MFLFSYLEISVYIVAILLNIAAASLIYNLQFINTKNPVYRLRLADQVKETTKKLKFYLHDDGLEALLTATGRPLSLSSISFNLTRLVIIIGCLLYLNVRWFLHGGVYPLNSLLLVLLTIILTYPIKSFPVYRFLEKLREIRLREKNKEIFTLYSMIQNEFYTNLDRPLNMYTTLNKLKVYFKSIDRSIGKAVLLWKKNPAAALDAFVAEVGTDEARDLANILKNVDLSSPEDARDMLDSRYEQFVAKRHENHRRYKNNIGLMAYIAALFPVFAVIYNVMVIFNLEKQELLKFIHHS